jgi:hypothetical protein
MIYWVFCFSGFIDVWIALKLSSVFSIAFVVLFFRLVAYIFGLYEGGDFSSQMLM